MRSGGGRAARSATAWSPRGSSWHGRVARTPWCSGKPTRMVGVAPNAAYRHFADRDELLAAVSTAAMHELAARMATGVARVRGKHGDPGAARRRLSAVGTAYLTFARRRTRAVRHRVRLTPAARLQRLRRRGRSGAHPPGSFARRARRAGRRRRAAAAPPRRHRIPHLVHRARAQQSSPGKDRCATSPTPPAITSRNSSAPSSSRPWHKPARPAANANQAGRVPELGPGSRELSNGTNWGA